MNDTDEQHAPESSDPTPRPRVLDYARPQGDQQFFLGMPLRRALTVLLAVEIVAIVGSSLILDGGRIFLATMMASVLGWIVTSVALWRGRYRLSAPDYILIGLGILATGGAVLLAVA